MIFIHNRNAPKYCFTDYKWEIINYCVENNQEYWSYFAHGHTAPGNRFLQISVRASCKNTGWDKLAVENDLEVSTGSKLQLSWWYTLAAKTAGSTAADEGKLIILTQQSLWNQRSCRDLWRPSKSNSCPKQGHLEQAAQGRVQSGFELQG